MQQYIGVKLVNMKPMTRLEYNIFRGWNLSADENGEDEGYLVEYLDGGKPNTDQYAGYVSWSPKEQAENAYRQTNGMTFGLAIEAIKKGKQISRAGWNGPGQYVSYQPGVKDSEGPGKNFLPYFLLKTSQGNLCVWVPSTSDLLADDWAIVK